MSKNKHHKPVVVEETVVSPDETTILETEPEDEVTIEPEIQTVKGVITDCVMLNIRKEPKEGDNVVAKVTAGVEVEVDPDFEDDTFYKVCTAAGIEGYCMKRFINILK